MELICPLCGGALEKREKSLICPNRHSFDIARQGYVHLLPVQSKHSRSPGDTREQVASRRRFLEGGFYEPIAQAVTQARQQRAQHEQREAVRTGVDGKAQAGEAGAQGNAGAAVEPAVVVRHEEGGQQAHQRAEGHDERSQRMAHAGNLDDVGLEHPEGRAGKAHVHKQERKAAGADNILVVLRKRTGSSPVQQHA